MPVKRRQAGGLHRVLGTAALFSTAYGNVGSSIYYALGLVTVYALGSDAGRVLHLRRDLLLHGGDLCRGHRPLPRGGRLGVVHPARIQRGGQLLRRLGADAELHRHDRDLGDLRAALPGQVLAGRRPDRAPQRHLRRSVGGAVPGDPEHRRGQGGRRAEHLPGAGRPGDSGAAGGDRPGGGVLTVGSEQQRRPRHRADVEQLHRCHPGGDGGLHRHRDRLQHVGGGDRPGPARTPRDHVRGDRGVCDLRLPAVGGALGAAGTAGRRRRWWPTRTTRRWPAPST